MHTIADFTIDSLYLLLAIVVPLVHIAARLLNDVINLVIWKLSPCLCLSSDIILALSILSTTSLKLWNIRLGNNLVVVLNEIIVSFRLLLPIAQRRGFLRHSRVYSWLLIILVAPCQSPSESLFRPTFTLESICRQLNVTIQYLWVAAAWVCVLSGNLRLALDQILRMSVRDCIQQILLAVSSIP